MLKKIFIAVFIFFLIAASIVWYIIYKKPTGLEPVGNTPNNPFGTLSPNRPVQPGTTASSTDNIPLGAQEVVKNLIHVSTEPSAGVTLIDVRGASTTIVRFIDRATAHITDFDLTTGSTLRISNTTIPKIYETLWFGNNEGVMLRYIDKDGSSIATYSANIVLPKNLTSTSTTVTRELQGRFLASNIESMAISPSQTKAFYMLRTHTSGQGITINTDGSSRTQIFNSPIGEWLVSWPQENTITLTTKAAAGFEGYLYFLNAKTGALTRILSNIQGLTTNTDPTGTKVAYSDQRNALKIFTPKTGSVEDTGLNTLAEKCVWSKKNKDLIYCAVPVSIPSGLYPDVWYQGAVSFSDNIYSYNLVTRKATLIGNVEGGFKESIDIIDPVLSPGEEYLAFRNKKDGNVWAFRLTSTTP